MREREGERERRRERERKEVSLCATHRETNSTTYFFPLGIVQPGVGRRCGSFVQFVWYSQLVSAHQIGLNNSLTHTELIW